MLLDQSAWWLVPFVIAMLAMVFAMMQFTLALLAKRPARDAEVADVTVLRERLLAVNRRKKHPPYTVAEGADSDCELRGDTDDGKVHYRGWLLLDDARKEVLGCELLRGRQRVLGMPRTGYRAAAGVQMGYLGLNPEVVRTVTEAGWTYRPVLHRFQTTRGGARLFDRLTPERARRWSGLRFWGVVYALTFFGGLVYFAAVIWPLTLGNLLIMVFVSAVWWGIWGLIAWVLLGFPRFWLGRV